MAKGLHLNSPLMDQVYSKCKDLNMPLSIHVSEPYWFYLDIDASNDGLMNAEYWHIDTSVPDRHNYQQLLAEFGEAVSKNPETMFIACHYMNANHDLDTADEHFYYPSLLYHWNYSAYDISDDVLKKVYYENAERVFGE